MKHSGKDENINFVIDKYLAKKFYKLIEDIQNIKNSFACIGVLCIRSIIAKIHTGKFVYMRIDDIIYIF